MHRWIFFGALAVFFAGVLFFYAYVPHLSEQEVVTDLQTIHLDGVSIRVTVVDTPEARAQGLSGKDMLGSNEGMLFIFPEDGMYGFWMKDMLFPIDIVWISADKKVVHIDKNVSPDTYPQVFEPPFPIRYVLELPAGSAEEYTVVPGSQVDF